MKRPYFSIFGAIATGMLTVLSLITFFFARGPGDALTPFLAMIYTILFGVPFLLFMTRIIRFNRRKRQARNWWDRDDG